MGLFALGHLFYVGVVNPEVLAQRVVLRKGTERWDWVWLSVFYPVLGSIFLVAHLDILSGSDLFPQSVRPVGLVLFLLGGGLFLRAMGENPFFEKTVRIQKERDHRVIDTGPYRAVRHPGYVGMIAWLLSFPLLLTSAWAFLPVGLAVLCLVVRTALEDRTLSRKLPGYNAYSARVRARLFPGVW
jgi:protein-S-isoprenylcysteine O-methyltransferase Ste14